MDKELRKFGFNLGLGLNILGCIMFYRHREHFIWFSSIGSAGIILAIFCPIALSPLKRILDKLISIIGWFTSFISICIVFYLIFTPVAILLKIFGKDLLKQRMDKKSSTYWTKRKEMHFSNEFYERMG